MSKHTRGPWFAVGHSVEAERDKPSHRAVLVAHVYDEVDNGPPEWRWNARLIAAAPDLLEAARAAYEVLPLLPTVPGMEERLWARKALHAALARAEGRE